MKSVAFTFITTGSSWATVCMCLQALHMRPLPHRVFAYAGSAEMQKMLRGHFNHFDITWTVKYQF